MVGSQLFKIFVFLDALGSQHTHSCWLPLTPAWNITLKFIHMLPSDNEIQPLIGATRMVYKFYKLDIGKKFQKLLITIFNFN